MVGPTASGKSALAVRLARQFNGEIISADSRQVYRGLDIGSGKLEVGKRGGIKHHLLDVASPKRTFTAARYKKLAEQAIKDIVRRGRLPILCGGTGFYIDALLGHVTIPPVPPNIKLRRQLDKLDDRQLFEKLETLDSARAKNIDRHNRRRLIRAIEVAINTKGSPWGSKDCPLDWNYQWLMLGIKLDPDKLRNKINTRLKSRINHGLIAEVKRLRRNGLTWARLEALGLDYRLVARYLRKLLTKEQMIRELETASWQYAKRQTTWWKRDRTIQWVKNYREAERLTKHFLAGPPRLERGTTLLESAVLPLKL